MKQNRRMVLLAAATLVLPLGSRAQQVDIPNFIPITPLLFTSGQPSEEALRTLGARGFQAVVYLAPSDVPNAVRAEPELLSAQGVEFIQIPIPFGAPDDSHVQALFAALKRLQGRKVLVHCEINMRASTLVFLYRAIQLREDPAVAYEAVARVWSPRGPWKRLAVDQLAKNNIKFELY
jgi:protein tyrosine phosphatase (PTP) superfamily phosphohydrolase (DUF442 family)